MRMHNISSLKQEFLKKWAMGLQTYRASKKDMSIWERKKAIKLSADIAMASTRTANSYWSRALIYNSSKNHCNKVPVEHVLGSESECLVKASTQLVMNNKRVRSKKILKRSCSVRRMKKILAVPQVGLASSIAKRLVKKRTQVLKSLLPGGEFMDEFSLIKETLDYIVSLRVQVDVMQQLADATDRLNRSKVINKE
ncbi:unnamed protein product [Ilex paraguariensis]|uniref:IBH1-like N-terminal domain-containing protein n=1 Tax=Ilex paraguariensis TaxID=185542 RepID=A0ABC8R5K9_9AQUA